MKHHVFHWVREILLLLATLIILLPIFYFVISAFKLREDILFYPLQMTPKMFTFENFTVAFSKMKYFEAVKNTAFITIGSLLLTVIFGSMTGFAIARVRARRFTLTYSFLVALMVVPFIGCVTRWWS